MGGCGNAHNGEVCPASIYSLLIFREAKQTVVGAGCFIVNNIASSLLPNANILCALAVDQGDPGINKYLIIIVLF